MNKAEINMTRVLIGSMNCKILAMLAQSVLDIDAQCINKILYLDILPKRAIIIEKTLWQLI